VDEAGIGFAASNALTRLLKRLQKKPQDMETLERANVLTSLFPLTPFPVDSWHAQNLYYSIFRNSFPEIARKQNADSRLWQERFLALGEKLRISAPEVVPDELQIAS
jgi:hypothetical protein